ncbi:PilZ domain-containing protein [Bacillus solitudinis]|uniref:PilZ domain-containing protein n=1 Tax=Bacillus solitudinis TaxID=2014074 RepID=UPI000C24F917|nr:PilZ domain-containing protein [Bacillus solitudinis]
MKSYENHKGKLCIVNTEIGIIVAEVVSFEREKLALKIIEKKNNLKLHEDLYTSVQIEQNEEEFIYFYEARVISTHKFVDQELLILYIQKQKKVVNNRRSNRIVISRHFNKKVSLSIRKFPPIDEKWFTSDIIDISTGGVKVKREEYLSKGQIIEVLLEKPFLQEYEIVVSRIVSVCENNFVYYYSIEFLNLSEVQGSHLNTKLQELKNKIS